MQIARMREVSRGAATGAGRRGGRSQGLARVGRRLSRSVWDASKVLGAITVAGLTAWFVASAVVGQHQARVERTRDSGADVSPPFTAPSPQVTATDDPTRALPTAPPSVPPVDGPPEVPGAATATGPVASAQNGAGSGAARPASSGAASSVASAPAAARAPVPQAGGSPLPGWLQAIVNVVGI
jgi:hypothetical protein